MIKYTIKIEDQIIEAYAIEGSAERYAFTVVDKFLGPTDENSCRTGELTYKQVLAVIAFNLYPDGEPPGFEEFYKELEPIFKDWHINLRPIP